MLRFLLAVAVVLACGYGLMVTFRARRVVTVLTGIDPVRAGRAPENVPADWLRELLTELREAGTKPERVAALNQLVLELNHRLSEVSAWRHAAWRIPAAASLASCLGLVTWDAELSLALGAGGGVATVSCWGISRAAHQRALQIRRRWRRAVQDWS